VTYPANFMLIGAMNPCPCGYHGDPIRACTCPPSLVARYHRRLSGPLLDRIDIFIEVPRVDYEKLAGDAPGEPSRAVRTRVDTARRRHHRLTGLPLAVNAEMGPAEVRKFCRPDKDTAPQTAPALCSAARCAWSVSVVQTGRPHPKKSRSPVHIPQLRVSARATVGISLGSRGIRRRAVSVWVS
jgi:predicted ATPase with chaperone activity